MYFEDYEIGMIFDKEIEPIKFSEEELIWAGEKYDPRAIHTDKEKAAASSFGRIISPGSYSNMAFWGQWVKTDIDKPGIIAGMSIEYGKWLRPVYPDTLYDIKVEIIDKKVRKEGVNGAVTYLMTATNPEGEVVSEYCCTGLVRFRPE